MARQQKPAMVKSCEICGKEMVQPRWKNGKLDSTFKERRFCGIACYGKANEIENPTIQTVRKRDGRKIQANECEKCGATATLQRHHVDKVFSMVLCQKCHTAEHMKDGTWGRSKGRQLASMIE